MPARLPEPGALCRGPVHAAGAARQGSAGPARPRCRPNDGQHHRDLGLSATGAERGGTEQASHRPRRHWPRRCSDPVRAALRLAAGGRRGRRMARYDQARRLSRLDRAGCRERRLPAVRPRQIPGRRDGRGPRPRAARRDRQKRHPQRAADLDRADRHDLLVCRQCFVRPRAGVQLSLYAQRADAGRQPARGGGRGLRLSRVPPAERPMPQVQPRQTELPLPAPAAPRRPADPYEAGGVVYMTQPLSRPEALPGQTYKIRWPDSEHALYITLNDIIQDGRRRPFEIFINSKNMEHFAWTVGLTRMISAVFRRGGDVSFVVEEMKAVFDPRGGAWVDGKYVPSLLAAIGDV